MDTAVLDWVVAHRTAWVTDVFTAITTLGNTVAVAAATVILAVALAARGRRVAGVVTVLGMLAGWAIMNGIKYAVRRDRPPIPERLVDLSTYSFPSGHAMMSAMFAAVVIGVVGWRWVWPIAAIAAVAIAALAAVAIGVSRVYLGAHWASDVLAGWAFGAVWGVVIVWASGAITRGRVARRDLRGEQRDAGSGTP